jgi:hypothetical protein
MALRESINVSPNYCGLRNRGEKLGKDRCSGRTSESERLSGTYSEKKKGPSL